ncbi:7447_t:CDS:2 [Acaulospora colombiana]|uniref:7447_t:CDS:1 n=1 Tax=Acaulospora colombiana TaxID=27376 RepID=A0ACA9LBW4_9GLOM|nr:7447_t:CDS:2 [Acaulospora colombiana]
MDGICTDYKKAVGLIVEKFQERNARKLEEIPKIAERYITQWEFFVEARREKVWQNMVAKLLFNFTKPELATLPSLQLLHICNDLLSTQTIPMSFRNTVMSIIGRGTENVMFEQLINEILPSLESNEVIFARMSFINRCLNIIPYTSPIRQRLYTSIFQHTPSEFASPIIQRVFLDEDARCKNAFLNLIGIPHNVLSVARDLEIVNSLLKANDLNSPIAVLCCDIIQKTFFRCELDELHNYFPYAVEALRLLHHHTSVVEPLQCISAIAFLKEYIRTFFDANKNIIDDISQRIGTHMEQIVNDINMYMEFEWPLIHSFKIYFLKYLRHCGLSMDDVRELCKAQNQTFSWLGTLQWENSESRLSFNPYCLHRSNLNAITDNFISFLINIRDVPNWMNTLEMNDRISFAGMVATHLHVIRASREWTEYEVSLVEFLGEKVEAMDNLRGYKEMLKKLLLNENLLIQLSADTPNTQLFITSVIVHIMMLHASISEDANPLAAYFHKLQDFNKSSILTCPSDMEGVVLNAIASDRTQEGAKDGVTSNGKCANCKEPIGSGSTGSVRLDQAKITSVEIKHLPGYIIEQTNKPQQSGDKINIGDIVQYCLGHIRNDWEVLGKQIINCSDERLSLILHAILLEMYKGIMSNECRRNSLNTPEGREMWEDEFTKKYVNPKVDNVTFTAQDISMQAHTAEISQGRGVGIVEAEIDDLNSETSEEYRIRYLPRLWRKIGDVSLESLHSYYISNTVNNTRFPFLDVFFKYENNLHLIKNLLPILKFAQILKTRLEHQITRQQARELTFREFIDRESNNGDFQEISEMLHSAFENFEKSWNTMKEYVKGYKCRRFNAFPSISLDSSVVYGLVEERDDIMTATPVNGIDNNGASQYYLSTMHLEHMRPENFIDYAWNDQILRYSQRNLDIRYGEHIIYYLLNIEIELARQLVFNKVEDRIEYKFLDIDAKYKEQLSRNMKKQITKIIKLGERVIKRSISSYEFLVALRRFLVRYLSAEYIEHISENQELSAYITNEDLGCWPSKISLEIARDLIPVSLKVRHTLAVYEYKIMRVGIITIWI